MDDTSFTSTNSMDEPGSPHEEFAALTSQIVSAFVMQNKLPVSELPAVIASVHASLASLAAPPAAEQPPLVPLMPIKKTLTADYLVSLEDGRHYKSLKRHLTGRGLTPASYREKWGLPVDYPMVAPNYAKQRSELAKALGLGQQRRKRTTDQIAAPDASPPQPLRKRGRPKAVAS